jgi:hypothetical protein
VRRPDRSLVLAAGGFAAAALLFAAALARALTVDPTPPDALAAAVAGDAPDTAPAEDRKPERDDGTAPATSAAGSPPAPRAGRPEVDEGEARALSLEALTLAVDNDPFQPDRRRPDEPYRMPGEEVDELEAPPPPPPPPPFQLLGTAEMIEGGIAVLRVEESLPRVMTVGEYVMGYRLDAVKGDAATLTGNGQTVRLTVAQASPHPEPERRGRGEGDDDDDDRRRGSAAERVREQREQALQRALEQQLRRQEGAAMDELRRFMQQRGQPNRDIRFENGRIIIRGDTNMTVNRRGGGGEERR